MIPVRWWLLGGALAVAAVGLGHKVVKVVRSGRAIGGPEAYAAASGIVPGNPATLASAAGGSLVSYSLARLMASEAGGQPEAVKVAVAWAAKNEAARRGITVADLLLGAEKKYARQTVKGRYASTGQPPTAADVTLANRVAAGLVPDPTGGATNWDSPRVQDRLLASGTRGYRKTSAEVAAARRAEGFTLVTLPGVDPTVIRFWRRPARTGAALVS